MNIPAEVKHKWIRSSHAGRGRKCFQLDFVAWVCQNCGDWTGHLAPYKNHVCPVKDRRKRQRRRMDKEAGFNRFGRRPQ